MTRVTREGAEVSVVADDLALLPDAGVVDAEADAAEAAEENEEFGLRVNWQSETERIEAAEFLLATRIQEKSRRRIWSAVRAVREDSRDRLERFVRQRGSDAGSDSSS